MSVEAYFDQSLRGWIFNHARQNYWRVASWMSLDDLVQDGFLCFAKCARRYTFLTVKNHPLPEDRKQFMALVQSAFANHITNLANRRTATKDEITFSQLVAEDQVDDDLSYMLPSQPEEATLGALLAQAPSEIKALFELLARDGSSAAGYLRTRLRKRVDRVGNERFQLGHRKLRETTNEHYCRRLGLDESKIDLVSRLRQLLGLEDVAEKSV